jgi:drug/metabolite transporter (DMT)-like permease
MSVQSKPVSTLSVIIAFATVYLVWGSTYFFIQKAVNGFPPFIMGAIRFIAAGIIMMFWCILNGEKLFNKKNIIHAAIGGVLMLFVGNGAVIWVEQSLPSGMVAIIVSSAPIWFVLLDWPLWGENFKSKATIVGLISGFAGVILLFSERLLDPGTATIPITMPIMIILLIGSISWVAGSLYSKYKSSGGSSAVNTTWQMFAAGLAFIPGSMIRGEWQQIHWATVSNEAWFALIYLITMGSIAGFSAYVWLLRVRPATQVSTYGYVNPVVAVILGVFIGKEVISHIQIIGLTIILGSVLLINLHKYRKSPA